MSTFTPRLTRPVHGSRKLGRRRVSELHTRAYRRMERRARMYNWMCNVDEVLDRLGPRGRSLAKAMRAAEERVKQLYEEAKDLETRLWNAYPPCLMCEGSKTMHIVTTTGTVDKECTECDGSGYDRRG